MVLEIFLPWIKSFILEFSYIAVFIVSLISTSTIFIPFPLYVAIFFATGLGLNPILVGVFAGLGSAVGEFTGYFVGAGGRMVVEEKKSKAPKIFRSFSELFQKYGFAVIIATSFLPFPFDIIGILSGASKYDIKKFFIGTLIGKTAKTMLIAFAGYFAIPLIHLIISVF